MLIKAVKNAIKVSSIEEFNNEQKRHSSELRRLRLSMQIIFLGLSSIFKSLIIINGTNIAPRLDQPSIVKSKTLRLPFKASTVTVLKTPSVINLLAR